MKYQNGQEVSICDKVVADSSDGVVVCIIETGRYYEKYPDFWAYLEKGVLIETTAMGLVHYLEIDEDVLLVER